MKYLGAGALRRRVCAVHVRQGQSDSGQPGLAIGVHLGCTGTGHHCRRERQMCRRRPPERRRHRRELCASRRDKAHEALRARLGSRHRSHHHHAAVGGRRPAFWIACEGDRATMKKIMGALSLALAAPVYARGGSHGRGHHHGHFHHGCCFAPAFVVGGVFVGGLAPWYYPPYPYPYPYPVYVEPQEYIQAPPRDVCYAGGLLSLEWRRGERGVSVGLDTQCSVKPASTTASI